MIKEPFSVKPLVECIPNFSEGRRPEVIQAIVGAVRSIPGVAVLDYSSDFDHNRSVLTYVGPPDAIEAATFEAIRTAAGLIDMRQHSGEHPRIGATDVVPFVPIRGVSMSDCVEIARRLGKRVGEELHIPVYLYEQAASRPDRENLANIRKGEYEDLAEQIRTDPDRAPDFGPCELGAAGATVIGARAPLIAYNVYLNTDDVEAAKKTAKAIRHSSGGLRFAKGLGLLVEGRAQVSMNLTDYTHTPIHRVQEMIRSEAARYGYQIAFAELIGMIPEQALIDAAKWYLQLDLFNEEQILEWKIQAVESETLSPDDFIEAVASGEPVPGGGSVAALAGALAAGLGGMVARTTIGKKKYAGVEAAMSQAASDTDHLRAALSRNIDADAAAFKEVMAAYRLEREDPARPGAIQAAMIHAAEVPLETMRSSVAVLEQLKVVAEHGNVNAATDAAAGVHMALAAVESAALNVLVNLKDVQDQERAAALRNEVASLRDQARSLAAVVIEQVEVRAGIQ
jgi:glutamate formiminotransferase/formiminotetrahydrofolate cyclodeaminase